MIFVIPFIFVKDILHPTQKFRPGGKDMNLIHHNICNQVYPQKVDFVNQKIVTF